MIKNILSIILTIFFASCEYEDFDDNKDVESPLATCVDGVAKIPGTDHEYSCLNYDLMGHVSLKEMDAEAGNDCCCLLYTSPSPRDKRQSRMPSSA